MVAKRKLNGIVFLKPMKIGGIDWSKGWWL